jgi:ABC-type nitrate/sulfonate/bicarbonate transport system substrate-binding protein/signal transduction histidine kinase
MSRRIFSAALLALGLTMAIRPGAAAAAEKIVLQLDRPAQFEAAGYYAALWRGYYRAAGLDVDIKPGAPSGQTPIDPVREVTEGRARFGTGSARLLIRDAGGLPLLLLAPIFQTSGARVYYRADDDFSSPGALLKARIGRLPASDILDIELRTALQAEGIDIDKLHAVPIKPGGAVAALADKTVDAVIGSAWRVPWQAQERGLALKSFDPAAYRPEFYGDSLFTLQRFAAAEPATVARFRAATLQGWEYALRHPDEMATRMTAELPQRVPVSDPVGFAHYQAGIARSLARYPAVPLGHSNPERWRHIAEAMAGVGALARPVDLGGFLYDPEAATRRSFDIDRRGWAMIAAAALAFVLVGGGLVWRRRRRPPRGVADNAAALAEELRGIAERAGEALEHIRRHSPVQPQIGRFCATALDALDHLRVIVRRLAGEEAVNPTAVDLNRAVAAVERRIRRHLPRRVNLRLSPLPAAPLCRADPEAVMAAVVDLAKAAADDMPQGGDLIIGTRPYTVDAGAAAEMPDAALGDYVRLTVRDNGPGLSEDRLDRIFDPAATVRPPVPAALRLMRAFGGFVRVESAEGIGTAVHLYFPHWLEEGVAAGENDPGPAPREAAVRAAE